ncbi:SA1320 family protein [Streptococcus caprae]|uniref:SA1320 family protein n=1 Tax=Streptococcus caprae TaxID=1640501 RepID=A0ABV8CW92_9STRE
MLNEESLKRRINVSAEISDSVYEFENYYTSSPKDGLLSEEDKNNFLLKLETEMVERNASLPSGTHLVDYHYDERLGVAAIAVADDVTGETYIAYAGTNVKADGLKDVAADGAIGLNNSIYLRNVENSATSFYERVQRTGANITVTTGHSYGDFLATRTAIVEQTPYKFGYQGAPQSVSTATYFELFYDSLIEEGYYTKAESDRLVVLAQAEDARVKELITNYSGYAVTFSTTADVLTNALWEQGEGEIGFGGQAVVNGRNVEPLANGLLKLASSIYDNTELKPIYVGNVIAIDVPIQHDMTAYKNSMETMYYTEVAVFTELNSVDFNRDGSAEFLLSPEYLSNTSIIPAWSMLGLGSELSLDTGALRAISTNLSVISSFLSDLYVLNSQALVANQLVMDGVGQRKESYKTLISDYLESISLIQAVKDIDSAYGEIVDLMPTLSTVMDYSTYDFSQRFDNLGGSLFYSWYKANGSSWNYGSVVGAIDTLQLYSGLLNTVGSNNSDAQPSLLAGMFSLGTQTNVASKGEKLLNSFEDEIEAVTKGLGNRSGYQDAIPQAINEVLEAIHQNLQTLILCVDYTVSVTNTIITSMEATDTALAEKITTLDLSSVPNVDTVVYGDYSSFLEVTGVFDDMKVIKAYDDQIDKKSSELAGVMSTEFTSYLNEVSSEISSTNTVLSGVSGQCDKLISQMADDVYYKKWGEKEKHFYGNVGSFISISSTINSLKYEVSVIDTELTKASTTINTTVSSLGNLFEPFRKGAEEAIYGLNGLEEILKSQKMILEVLENLKTRFTDMQTQLLQNKGVAVEALGSKMNEIISTMSNSEKLIDDCFGE